MSACAVAKGLYIGPQSALDQVEDLGITHVLSVVNYDVAPPDGVCHWSVPLEDAESANLLEQLPAAVTWLERALRQKGSKVLVHCNAGTSRSPSVVLAAVMKAKGLDVAKALDILRVRAPHVSPNPGFMAQLELWAEMGYAVDETHPTYKQFLLDQVARQYEEEGYVDPASFTELPTDESDIAQLVRYRCRKCRQLIATQHNVIPTAGVGRRRFRRQRHQPQQQQQQQGQAESAAAAEFGDGIGREQGSVFLEPMQWMVTQVVGPVQGKLYCTNCQARLGSFNWAGISNSEGSWMIPGFQLHLSRLDVLSPKPPAALAGMRFPVALAEHRAVTQQQQQGDAGGQQQQQQAQADFLPDLQDHDASHKQQQQQNGVQQKIHKGVALQQQQQQQQNNLHDEQAGADGVDQLSLAPLPPPPQQQQQRRVQDHQQQQEAVANGIEQLSLQQQQQQQQQQEHIDLQDQQQQQQQPQPWFQYVVLDCDGVLVDTEAASCEALRRAILQVTGVDIPHDFPADFTPVFGMDVRSCLQHYKQSLDRQDWQDVPALAAAVQAAKEQHYQQLTAGGIQALPGASALIQSAKQLQLPVGVASSGAPAKIQRNLTSSGLISLLPTRKFIVSASEVRAGKPAPDVYLEVLRRMGCEDASRALVVEDAVHGLVAARAAGAFCVAVTNSLPAEVLAPHADLVVGSLQQLDLKTLAPRGK